MKVIERYILSRAFVVFLSAFSAAFAVLWTTQALSRVNLITTNGQSVLTFLKISTLTLPSIIPEVLPFAVAIAVAQTLAVMNADSELVVINATGARRSTVIRPLIVLALGVSIVSFAVTNALDPLARLSFRKMLTIARNDLIAMVLQEDAFSEIETGLYIQVGEQLPGGDLGSVFLADSRSADGDVIYYAKRGAIVERDDRRLMLMRDGMIQRKALNGEVAVIRFETYTFDLSKFGKVPTRFDMQPRDRTLAFLLDPDPTDRNFRKKPQEFRAELHRRLSEWSFPLVFALIALAVGGDARSHRESRISPILTVMVLALVVRWLSFVVVARAETAPVFIFAIYAVPLTVAALALWFIWASRSLEVPRTVVDAVASGSGRMLERLKPRRARAPASMPESGAG